MSHKSSKPDLEKNDLFNNLYKLYSIWCEISNNLDDGAEFDDLMKTETKNFVERELVIQTMMKNFPDMTYQLVLEMWEDMKINKC